MAEETTTGSHVPFDPSLNVHQGILDQTLAEVLQTNPQAQQTIMRSMNIPSEKFQQMLFVAQQNDMMHVKIRDLFANGFVQQALTQQDGVQEQVQQNQTTSTSLFDKIKNFLRQVTK